MIDDDKDVLGLFSEYPKIVQVNVIGTGRDGKRALERSQEKKPDGVFVDLAMPEYDDIFALKNIRKVDPAAKIIIVTGNLQKDVSEELDYLSPDKILREQFEVERLWER